jgi:uncharacterized HAD superfamily protein
MESTDLTVLNNVWERQRLFQDLVSGKFPETPEARVKEYVLHIFSELNELLDSVNWRIHRELPDRKLAVSNVLEEITDIWKYLIAICLDWGIKPEDLVNTFHSKSDVVEQRYVQERWSRRVEGNIVGVDIDGVLCDYGSGMIDFINQELGTNYSRKGNIYHIERELDLDQKVFDNLLHKFREIGGKRTLPVYPDSSSFLYGLKGMGYSVVLLTARPYDKYPRIFSDTLHWLKDNNLVFDAVLFNENKDETLVNTFGIDKVCFFVEDTLEQAHSIAKRGIRVFLMDKPYNRCDLGENIIRVMSFGDIFRDLGGKKKI